LEKKEVKTAKAAATEATLRQQHAAVNTKLQELNESHVVRNEVKMSSVGPTFPTASLFNDNHNSNPPSKQKGQKKNTEMTQLEHRQQHIRDRLETLEKKDNKTAKMAAIEATLRRRLEDMTAKLTELEQKKECGGMSTE